MHFSGTNPMPYKLSNNFSFFLFKSTLKVVNKDRNSSILFQIKYYKSKNIFNVILFKILNSVSLCILLDIKKGKGLCPVTVFTGHGWIRTRVQEWTRVRNPTCLRVDMCP